MARRRTIIRPGARQATTLAAAAHDLEEAFTEYLHRPDSSPLRVAVCAYVAAVKADGAPLETAVVRINEIARRVTNGPGSDLYLSAAQIRSRDQAVSQLISHCVKRFALAGTSSSASSGAQPLDARPD